MSKTELKPCPRLVREKASRKWNRRVGDAS